MKREPITMAGLVIILVKVLLSSLTTMGVLDLSQGQQQAMVGLAVAVVDVAVVVAALWWGRSKVTSTKSPQIITSANKRVDLIREDGEPLE